MWAWVKSKIVINKSLKALEKSAAEKIGGDKKWIFKIAIIKTKPKKKLDFFGYFLSL